MPESRTLEAIIAQLLQRAPPLVSGILDLIMPEEGYSEFLDLVEEFIPDRRAEILAEVNSSVRIELFAVRFREQYFPIPWFEDHWSDFCYEDLIRTIPITPIGVDHDDWHQIPEYNDPGRKLLAAICSSPFEYAYERGDEWGTRIPLIESLQEEVPQDLLERLPKDGYSQEDLHRWLDGTDHSGVALFCDVLWHDTRIYFLDVDSEEWPTATWDRETVVELSAQWLRCQELMRQTDAVENWLEADPPARFRELLDFIDARKEKDPEPKAPVRTLRETYQPET